MSTVIIQLNQNEAAMTMGPSGKEKIKDSSAVVQTYVLHMISYRNLSPNLCFTLTSYKLSTVLGKERNK